MEEEIWKDIKDYEGLYQVSNLGNVRSLDRIITFKNGTKQFFKGKILKQKLDKNGYLRVTLTKNNHLSLKQVHRLVGIAFIPNPENKPTINHKKGIKTDNRVSQLEWATYQEQTQHAIKTGLINFKTRIYINQNEKAIEKTRKPIKQYDLNGNFISKYIGVNEAQRITHINNISRCLTGKKKQVGGYIWKYAEE